MARTFEQQIEDAAAEDYCHREHAGPCDGECKLDTMAHQIKAFMGDDYISVGQHENAVRAAREDGRRAGPEFDASPYTYVVRTPEPMTSVGGSLTHGYTTDVITCTAQEYVCRVRVAAREIAQRRGIETPAAIALRYFQNYIRQFAIRNDLPVPDVPEDRIITNYASADAANSVRLPEDRIITNYASADAANSVRFYAEPVLRARADDTLSHDEVLTETELSPREYIEYMYGPVPNQDTCTMVIEPEGIYVGQIGHDYDDSSWKDGFPTRDEINETHSRGYGVMLDGGATQIPRWTRAWKI